MTRPTGPALPALSSTQSTARRKRLGESTRAQAAGISPAKLSSHLRSRSQIRAEASLTFYLSQKHGGWNSDDNQSHNLGRFRLSITQSPDAVADPLPRNVREILAIPAAQRTPAQVKAVFGFWRTTVPEFQEANARIEQLWQKHPQGSSQLALLAREEMRDTHMLTRGDFLKPGKTVAPGVPAFLNPLPKDAPPNRLTFAKWLVDRQSPTTARSQVNRIWQTYFGIGLVSTSEDLGKQSEAPSHPELLDWMAVEFMDRGWSLKAMHRLIVNSATYRQSSRVSPELLARDPYNRLLARGSSFSRGSRGCARYRTGGERPDELQNRRAKRLSASTGLFVPSAGELRPEELV